MAAAERIAIEDGGLLLYRDACADTQQRLLEALRDETPWTRHTVRLFGRQLPSPRLSSWHAEPGCRYRYSGTTHEPLPFTPAMLELRARVEALSGQPFNSVLLNCYRDGQDAMSWHSDDEPELGPAPLVASLSLGATRRFLLRARGDHRRRVALDLPGGSLLLMEPPLQAHWQHALPRTRRPGGMRLNLTWRLIVAPAPAAALDKPARPALISAPPQ